MNEKIKLTAYIAELEKKLVFANNKNNVNSIPQNNLFEQIIETNSSIIVALNKDHLIRIFNKAAEDITGYNREEVLGKDWFKIIFPSKLEIQFNDIWESAWGVDSHSHTNTILTKNGEERIISWLISKHYNEVDENYLLVAIGNDITNKAITEKKLKLLSIAVEESPASVVITDVLGKIEYVNNKFIELTGYSLDEVKGENPRVLKSDIQSDQFYKKMWETIASGKEWRGEFKNKKKNGELYWESAKISSIKDENGVITHFIAVKEDITKKRNYENQIRKSRYILNETQKLAKIGGWEYRIADRRVIWTKETFNIFGLKEGQALSPQETIKCFNDEDIPKISHAFFNLIRNGDSFDFEAEFTNFKNKKIWVQVSTTPIYKNGVIKKVIGYISDITEQKQMQFSLIENEKRFQLIAENTGIVFYQLNENLIDYIYMHSNIEKLTGFTPAELDLKSIIKKIEVNDKVIEFSDYIKNKIDIKASVFKADYLVSTKSGEEKWLEDISYPNYDNNKKQIGRYGVLRDITEKKNRVIEKLIKAKEDAEKSDNMKSIFLAQMSHEIRTPINALVSMSSLLRLDFDEFIDEDQQTYFDVMDRAGNRIIRTIDLILNLSEIQAGTYKVMNTEIDIYEDILFSIFAEYQAIAKKKGVVLNLEKPLFNKKIIADSYTVHQIFVHLIDNAINYTEEGLINIKMSLNNKKKLIVEIKDTGIGISKDYLPKLFEPFSQEEMGYSRKYDGNGIGLALVKEYCELNKANIEVESKKDVGSTFRVIF